MTSRTAYSMSKPMTPTLFSGHYLRNRSTLDIGVLGYIGIVSHKEHSPEVSHIPPGTPRMLGKERFAELGRIVGPLISKDTNCRQCVGFEDR